MKINAEERYKSNGIILINENLRKMLKLIHRIKYPSSNRNV